MSETVTPSQIAQILREPYDVDLWIDVKTAKAKLPEDEQAYLDLYALDLTPTEIVRRLGATNKNPKRWHESIMKKLYEEVNNEKHSS